MKIRKKALENALHGNLWVYGPQDEEQGRWGKMTFLTNGRVFGYDHANEYRWDFSNDAFRFLTKDGEATSIFDNILTENGRVLLQGRSVQNPDSLYRLEQADPAEV